MEKAVHARHQYQEAMHEIVWCNAVIGALTFVLGDDYPTPGCAKE